MKILICEDEKMFSSQIARYASEWAKQKGVFAEMFAYESAEKFMYDWREGEDLDIIFMDIKMGAIDGMELAKIIRRTNADVPIVFVTNMEGYALEGYSVAAMDFIVKPAKKEAVFSCLDRSNQNERVKKHFLFEGVEKTFRIAHEDIIYIEKFAHMAEIVTAKGKYEFRRTMAKLLEELDDDLFAQCHKSYIINIRHLDSLSKNYASMSNGAEIRLGKNMAKEINERFRRYNVHRVR